ncbi:MAG: holin [Propionibacteriaceae bacterium]|jgi:hypothetical protein|nr:holin [Propionibacteriaceae bacterium]
MFTKAFWLAEIDRLTKVFASAMLGVIGVNGIGLLDADWLGALSVAGMAVTVSLLSDIGSAGITGGYPSLTRLTTSNRATRLKDIGGRADIEAAQARRASGKAEK